MANKVVALSRIKSGGKFYEVGDDVSKLDDVDNLKASGVAGSASELKQVEKERDDSNSRVEELEAQVADLQSQLEAAQLEASRAKADTQESVTDAEAQAKREQEEADAKKIGN